jgi:hypothetical protein
MHEVMFLVKEKKIISGFQHVELETINGLWFLYAYILSTWLEVLRERLLKVPLCCFQNFSRT